MTRVLFLLTWVLSLSITWANASSNQPEINLEAAAPRKPSPGPGKCSATKVLAADFPAGFSFLPDGRIVYLERFAGNVVFYNEKQDTKTQVCTVDNIVHDGEDGLLGVAVHPDYPSTPHLFVYATRSDNGQKNQILRIEVDTKNDNGTVVGVIFTSDKAPGQYHDGGRILFNPSDKKLFAIVGDAHQSDNAQSLSTDKGKILRMNYDGTAPANNPFNGSLIFAYGIRNSFGFTFDPETGNLWESENGPSCNDEINLIVKGGNYGWGPSENCPNTNQDGKNIRKPKYFWPKNLPSAVGVAFNTKGDLLVGSYNRGLIFRAKLNTGRSKILKVTTAYTLSSSQDTVLSLERHPVSNAVYFSSPNGIYNLGNC